MPSKTITAVKASPLALAASIRSEDAFIAIIGACLRHAEANQPAVLAGHLEGIHQMRVAFRRLRSGLKLFRPLVPGVASAMWVADIRWLNGFLGPARDWDVFLEEGMPPLFTHFPRKRSLSLFRVKAQRIRETHHHTLREALSDPRYLQLTQGLAGWLDAHAWRDVLNDEQRERLAQPALDFATPLLSRDHRRVEKQGGIFAELSVEERHALRIRIKALRYAQDFFASLYPALTVKVYLSALARLQDSLGVMNDIAVARRLLDEARLGAASVARQVIEGWYGCRLDLQEHAFADLWRDFTACEHPWKD